MVLRRIKRRVRADGEQMVELLCGHIVAGRPESRYSRFYPCAPCDAYVQALRTAGAEQNPTVLLLAPPERSPRTTKVRRAAANRRATAVKPKASARSAARR